MNPDDLQKLEEAFEKVLSLSSSEEVQSYLRELQSRDPDFAGDLARLVNVGEQADDLIKLNSSRRLELLLTTFGTGEKRDTQQELFDFLRSISDSDKAGGLARLRGFELLELISLGASRFVFRGRDQNLQRDVAVKVLSPSVAKNTTDHQAFVQEARLSSSVRHPNVIMIHQVVSDLEEGLAFYVTDWVVGESLQAWLMNHPKPDRELAVDILQQLASGIDAIHRKGIIHRDLKPGNIVFNQESRQVTILDFGLAIEGARPEDERVLLAGTPLFMSPEQLACQQLTYQSDLFSLGEIGCLLLTGEHPYPVDSVEELSAELLHGEPKIPGSLESGGQRFMAVMKRALSRNPKDRYVSATEFVNAVTDALGYDSSKGQVAGGRKGDFGPIQKKRRLLGASLLSFVLVLVLLGSVAFLPNPVARFFRNRTLTDDGTGPSSPAGLGENGETSRAGGDWVGKGEFKNWLGMEFIEIPVFQYESWPPDPQYPELFENLGWRNLTRSWLVGENLVTQRQFALVMDQELTAEQLLNAPELDQPVTMITKTEADEFCRRLSSQDPDGLVYDVVSHNLWTLGVFGKGFSEGNSSLEGYSRNFSRLSQGTNPDELDPKALPGLSDVFGKYWEWTTKPALKRPNPHGIVPYDEISENSSFKLYEVLGGGTTDLFMHPHDFYFGMNDYYVGSSNLQYRIEEDGETAYLAPAQVGERGWVDYAYSFNQPIVDASVNIPFFLAHDRSRGGIEVRTNREDDEIPLAEQVWETVWEVEGKIYSESSGKPVDLTPWVHGATELEIRYWIEDSEEPLWYSQIGRTSLHARRFGTFLFQATTEGRGESMRQFVVLPETTRHPLVGFRVVATMPAMNTNDE